MADVRMKAADGYVRASLMLVGVMHRRARGENLTMSAVANQAWEVLAWLGVLHLEAAAEANAFTPLEVVDGAIPLALSSNSLAEENILGHLCDYAKLDWWRKGCDSQGSLVGGLAAIEFLLHVFLALRWASTLQQELGSESGVMSNWALLGDDELALVALLIAKAQEYQDWAAGQIAQNSDVCEYLVYAVKNAGNWLVNSLLELRLIDWVRDFANPETCIYPGLPLELSVQERENLPDWLIALLMRAGFFKS